MIKIGYMDYVNMFPINWHLEKKSYCELYKGVPSKLNEMLRAGILDVSPVSSFEYINMSERYRILPGIGLSAKEKVNSVIFCSMFPIQEMCDKKVFLTGDSLTSANLLKLILECFLNTSPKFVNSGDFDACLLIGDKALDIFYNDRPYYTYDLCEIWHKFTELPFVFSLWLVNASSADKLEISTFYKDLLDIIAEIPNNFELYADEYISRYPDKFTKSQLLEYWSLLYYKLGDDEIKGLRHFYKMLGFDTDLYYWGQSC